MAYSAIAVANAFIEKAKEKKLKLDPMQLQKLVFISNGWMMAVNDKLLVQDDFEVWRYGPVAPRLYHALKSYGKSCPDSLVSTWYISEDGDYKTLTPNVPKTDKSSHDLMNKILSHYGEMDALRLSAITHLENSPWEITNRNSGLNSLIPTKTIKNYYRSLLNK